MLIVTGADDNYVPGIMVLIASAAFHNPAARFCVLDLGIAPDNRARIDALGKRCGVSLRRIEVAGDGLDGICTQRDYLTRATFLRLLIPDLLPAERQVIYMDCDMAVMDSLADLDGIDLNGAWCAGVPCPSPDPRELAALGLALGTYVNTGLLVMDLDLWRREELAERCLAVLRDPGVERYGADQSAINLVCRGHVKLLPRRYNLYAAIRSYQDPGEVPLDAAVVHYVVDAKPWNGPAVLDRVWHFHARRIADLLPPLRPVPLRRRVSELNRTRKILWGAWRGKRDYPYLASMIARMNRQIGGAYLARARRAARSS